MTKDIIYERLAPGIIEELEKRNPRDSNWYRKDRHHQWLTDDVGVAALAQHLHAVIAFLRASKTWEQFYEMLNQAFPKRNDTLALPFMADASS
ncbi:MAG: P63C domain-containing protein [Nitrospira sp.]